MRKLALIGIILIVGSLLIVTASAQRDRMTERYAVGGEILPVSATSFLLSPWVLAIVMLLITVLGGAITTGKISIERI
jgi:uncharacterized membrane protein YidH (DUF202 family)